MSGLVPFDSEDENFPWPIFHHIATHREVARLAVEDGYPPLEKVQVMRHFDPRYRVYLFKFDGVMIGFTTLEQRGAQWGEIHAGFLPGMGGAAKKEAMLWTIRHAFARLGWIKLSAIIPVYNAGARFMVGSCGFEREGTITNSVKFEGGVFDRIIFGLGRAN